MHVSHVSKLLDKGRKIAVLSLPFLPVTDRTYWEICKAMQEKTVAAESLVAALFSTRTGQVTLGQSNKKWFILTSLENNGKVCN